MLPAGFAAVASSSVLPVTVLSDAIRSRTDGGAPIVATGGVAGLCRPLLAGLGVPPPPLTGLFVFCGACCDDKRGREAHFVSSPCMSGTDAAYVRRTIAVGLLRVLGLRRSELPRVPWRLTRPKCLYHASTCTTQEAASNLSHEEQENAQAGSTLACAS